MTKGLLFWVIMILLLLGMLWSYWPAGGSGGYMAYRPVGVGLIEWVLLGLLGWGVYGPMVK